VRNPERKRPLRIPRARWMDNIKIDVGGTGWNSMNRTGGRLL
jgi:hypothetical protein